MHIDFSGVEVFLAYRAGRATAGQVLEAPAYRAVRRHARLFGSGLTPQDVDDALQGKQSPFYGLDGLPERIEAIQRLLETLRREGVAWLATAESVLAGLFPGEALDIPVYPILGYDMGSGLDGAACLNVNHAPYLAQPREFLFYAIHECTHVIYERSHRLPGLEEIVSPADWRGYFNLWLQYEGYAVYAPLARRVREGCLADGDYRALMNPTQLEAHRQELLATLDALRSETPRPHEQYLEICFGPQRLTYRMGCELIRRIERAYGMQAVRQAFYMSGDEFVGKYIALLI